MPDFIPLERFRQVGQDQKIGLEAGSEQPRAAGTRDSWFLTRTVDWLRRGAAEEATYARATQAFITSVKATYGERIGAWATRNIAGHIAAGKPLTGYRVEQVLVDASKAARQEQANLGRLMERSVPGLINKALTARGLQPEQISPELHAVWAGVARQAIAADSRVRGLQFGPQDSFTSLFAPVVDNVVVSFLEAARPLTDALGAAGVSREAALGVYHAGLTDPSLAERAAELFQHGVPLALLPGYARSKHSAEEAAALVNKSFTPADVERYGHMGIPAEGAEKLMELQRLGVSEESGIDLVRRFPKFSMDVALALWRQGTPLEDAVRTAGQPGWTAKDCDALLKGVVRYEHLAPYLAIPFRDQAAPTFDQVNEWIRYRPTHPQVDAGALRKLVEAVPMLTPSALNLLLGRKIPVEQVRELGELCRDEPPEVFEDALDEGDLQEVIKDARAFKDAGLTVAHSLLYADAGILLTEDTKLGACRGNNVVGKPVRLGSGGFNTTQKVEIQTADGTRKEVVFKPLQNTAIGKDPVTGKERWPVVAKVQGIDLEDPQFELRNIACTKLARRLGWDVIAKSELGVVNGKLGLVMERAPGESPRFDRVKVTADLPGFEEIHQGFRRRPEDFADGKFLEDLAKAYGLRRFEVVGNELYATGRFYSPGNAGDPGLQEELAKLQLLDALTGQGDRHARNYFVERSADGKVRVTGIDNDQCLGPRLTDPRPSHLPTRVKKAFRWMCGIPPVIDRRMADAVLGLSADELQGLLGDLVTSLEIGAAGRRLEVIQRVVRHADPEEIRIIENDAWGPEQAKFHTEANSYLGREQARKTDYQWLIP